MYPPDKDAYLAKKFNLDLYKLYTSVNQSTEIIQKPLNPHKDHHPRKDPSLSTSFEQIMSNVFRKPSTLAP